MDELWNIRWLITRTKLHSKQSIRQLRLGFRFQYFSLKQNGPSTSHSHNCWVVKIIRRSWIIRCCAASAQRTHWPHAKEIKFFQLFSISGYVFCMNWNVYILCNFCTKWLVLSTPSYMEPSSPNCTQYRFKEHIINRLFSINVFVHIPFQYISTIINSVIVIVISIISCSGFENLESISVRHVSWKFATSIHTALKANERGGAKKKKIY